MANLSEDIQCAGSDTQPPMLDRTDFASWQQRIRLYCRGKENRVNILKSIGEGPFQMGTVREPLAERIEGAPHLGPEHPQFYSDLSPKEKDRYNADIRATNILLQGLPKDIYTLINHYTDAKDIWDNHKGETIHDYYVWFAKLINDMRNIKIAMSIMQLNSKFMNNMLPEWGRFVTAVKLNRGLRDSNFDKLYAYLKQHEIHANENKMMLDRFSQHTVDPLALMSNVSHQQHYTQSSSTSPSTYGRYNRGQGTNPWGGGVARYGGVQNRVGNANPGQARQVKCYNCNGGHDNAIDEDADEQPVQDLALNVDNVFQADDCDAFDFDVDEAPTAQTMFMANLSYADPVNDEAGPSYDSNILSEYVKDNAVPIVHNNVSSVPNDAYMMIYKDMYVPHAQSVSKTSPNTVVKNSLTTELETYKEQIELYERRARPKPYYNKLNKVAISYKNPLCLTHPKQVQPALYNGHDIIKDNHVSAIVYNTEDTLEIAEITRKKMSDKMKDSESELSNLGDKSHNDNHDELVNCFSNLEVNHLNMQLKYQNLKDSLGNNPPTPDKDTLNFDSVFVIGKIQASLQGKDNVNRQLKKKISYLQEIRSDIDRTLKVRAVDSQITQLTEKVNVLQAQNDSFRAENDKLKQHYKELNNREVHLDYLRHLKESIETIRDIVEETKVNMRLVLVRKTLTNEIKKLASAPLIMKKQVTFSEPSDTSNSNTHKHVAKMNTQKTNILVPPSTGVNRCTNASGSQPRSNTKNNRISLANDVNKMQVEEQPRTNKSHLRTSNRVDSSSRPKRTVVQIILWYLDSGCSKHMTGYRSRLMNFVKKFIRTVRFRNDHFGAIMGYGDYMIGDSVISKVYYVEGLGHNLFYVRQFYDFDLEVAFIKQSCYVRGTNGVELIKGSRGSNHSTISVEDMMNSSPIYLLSKPPRTNHDYGIDTVPRTPQQNGVVERRNHTLVEAARTMLIFSKAPMFLWAEAVAIACYTQNRSLIHTHHNKTPYEVVHNKKPDLTFFRVFGALCYPTNDSEDLGKLQSTADIGIFLGYAPSMKGYRIYNKRTRRIIETIHVQFDELTGQWLLCISVQDPDFLDFAIYKYNGFDFILGFDPTISTLELIGRVKNIEGKPTMPKGILKKAMRNVAADRQDVVVPLNDVNNANMDKSGSMKNKEDANLVKGDTTAMIAKSCSLVDSHGNKYPSTAATPNKDLPKTACSFANVVRPKDSFSKVHFCALINEEKIESFDCVLPKAAAAKVKSRYENSIVGFFVGKDPSFLVGQQYVSNTWRKFGFEKITRNDDGVYLFKFASKSGMDQVLEKGPWLIRKSPIILNKWTASVSLKKGEGRISFSRALIEISAHFVLKKEVTMAIPDEEGGGHTKEVIRVLYEWKPPHCVDCQCFSHDTNLCPKHVREEIPKTSATDAKANTMDENDDGFVKVKSRKKKKGVDSRSFGGLRLIKPNSKVIWQQKKGVDAKGGSSASPSVSTNDKGKGNGCSKPNLNSSNPFDVLNVEGEEMGESGQQHKVSEHVGTMHLNVNKKKAQEPSSSKSAINDVQEGKNVSSSPVLKT
nr:retrovirus-related Pol polyprotein from transposon TNT 1-94 [Tanacetum cinerariifolium]